MQAMGTRCHYCSIEMQAFNEKADNFFTLDHIIPKAEGGKGGDNVVQCCIKCNREKANKPINVFKRDRNMDLNDFKPMRG